ncbi:hypothetical protein PDE_07210 [Penicillium oxalicum 114-2]|uniref:Uncharacterized protein n=1 Tax=Penicillium oxalicum (strain 114-2 / CGMCC 5302) TaxID=933388 RepID=S7ZNJ6_PENO1|nr:hypothetical protein PDE_07210 [Penicillium oxalicum 114-2]
MDMSTFTLESVHSINSSTGTHHVVRLNRRTLSLSDSFYPLDPTRRAVVVHGWGRHLYRTISEVSFSRVVAEEVCAHLPLFYFLVFEPDFGMEKNSLVELLWLCSALREKRVIAKDASDISSPYEVDFAPPIHGPFGVFRTVFKERDNRRDFRCASHLK